VLLVYVAVVFMSMSPLGSLAFALVVGE